ncbi:sca1 complex scaffold protein scaa [Anaeramoeba flamelloides]|uniref:Sca1 complex scaffold protein scaa n=1 Tax=Anaeramoeba flamelloides TaxID=1746091 RepID=A0AAV8A0Q4_9EUKA|nr:sca1 complex scaffold protein scaa [Anaeramoeba flamelloides]
MTKNFGSPTISYNCQNYEGFRSSYTGPYSKENLISPTKLEIKNSKSVPIYMDSTGRLYDLYYTPIEDKPLSPNQNEEAIQKITELDYMSKKILNNEDHLSTIQRLSCKNLKQIPKFPNPDDYQTFEEFEDAANQWETTVYNSIGTLQLPKTIGGYYYKMKERIKNETQSLEQNTENDLGTETEIVTETNTVTETEGGFEENIDEIGFEDETILLNDNEELELYRLLEKENLTLNDKQQNGNVNEIDLKKVLTKKDPWYTNLIAQEPNPKHYLTFEEYERACKRWYQIVLKGLTKIPMHSRQFEKQALLKPYKKKIIKKKQNKTDFFRDYSTWKGKVMKIFLNLNVVAFKLLQNTNKTCFSLQERKKHFTSQPESFISESITLECKNSINSIFEKLLEKIKLNNTIYVSNTSPIVGRYTPRSMKKTSIKNKFNDYYGNILCRCDLKRISEERKYICKKKIESTKIDFFIPVYDIKQEIPWKILKSMIIHCLKKAKLISCFVENISKDSKIVLNILFSFSIKEIQITNFKKEIKKFNLEKIQEIFEEYSDDNAVVIDDDDYDDDDDDSNYYGKEQIKIENNRQEGEMKKENENKKKKNDLLNNPKTLEKIINFYSLQKLAFDEPIIENVEKPYFGCKNKNRNNLLLISPSKVDIICKLFFYIYKKILKKENIINLNDTILVSENFYNELICNLKKNINYHGKTLNLIGKFIKSMIKYLVQTNRVIGSNSNKNFKKKNSPKVKRKKKKTIGGLHRTSRTGSGSSAGSAGDLFRLNSGQQRNLEYKSILMFKEHRLLQIINLIENSPLNSNSYKFKKQMLLSLSQLIKERTIYLSIYNNGLFFGSIIKICSDVKYYKCNKVAWKIFYHSILYHVETMAHLIKNKQLTNFLSLLSVTSGIGVVNQLHYINKLLTMLSLQTKLFKLNHISYKRKYLNNPIKSFKKDTKDFINFMINSLHYTRFSRLFKSYVNDYNGAPFINLAKIFNTLLKKKYCVKLLNALRSNNEYNEVVIFFEKNCLIVNSNESGTPTRKRKKALYLF